MTIESGYALDLKSSGVVKLVSTGNDIILDADGSAYIGYAGSGQQIATQGYVSNQTTDTFSEGTTNLYFTNARVENAMIDPLTLGTQTNITVTHNPSTGAYDFVAENGVADSTTDDLTEGQNNLYFTVQRAIDAVTGGSGNGGASVYNTNNTIVKRDGFGQTELGHVYIDRLTFDAYDGGNFAGDIKNDGGELSIYGENYVRIRSNVGNVQITSNNGDIVLSPDGNVHVNSSVIATNNLYGRLGILGGPDNGNDGGIYVYNVDGTEAFSVDSSSNTTVVHGQIQIAPAGAGYSVVQITDDSNGNGIINGWNNNLILTSDNGANGVYLNYVANDNRVVTQGGSQVLTNKGLGTGTYLDADLDAASLKITNLATPEASGDAANKWYVDNAVAGLTWKAAANLLWDDFNASNGGVSGTLAIDGHEALTSAHNGYRILVTSGETAGIWDYFDDGDNWTLTRSSDADSAVELKGATIFIEEGDVYGQSAWTQANHYIADFADQVWVQFSGASQIIAGTGLTKTGNQLDVVGTANRIVANSDSIDIASTYVGQESINTLGTVTTGTWNADTIAVADGGTGATTAAGARENLGAVTKYAVNNPALTATSGSVSWVVTHNLGTEDVTVQLKDISSKQLVEVDVEITSTNTVTLSWVSSGVVDDSYRVVIVG